MFGFFKRANYRSKCTEVIFKVVGGHQQQCVDFVEDHKSLFDGFGNKGVQPGTAVGLANMVIIKALADGEEAKVRDYNNCKTTSAIVMGLTGFLLETMEDGKEKKEMQKNFNKLMKTQDKMWKEIKKVMPDIDEKLGIKS